MSEPKQVKVDNWGIYFLQRLKHFFNRTDYCDLTLQFQDNAQLKVHRLVLSACTEYFELLERTCEMYEDCLVMPDDLQADVVVPIVNFMYTGQLEFRMEILERLHATSEIMNMPVLTKLLDSHRPKHQKPNNSYGKRQTKEHVSIKLPSVEIVNTSSPSSAAVAATKRSFAKAFDKTVQNVVFRDKKYIQSSKSASSTNTTNGGLVYRAPSPILSEAQLGNAKSQKFVSTDPRPTRYELPEELDSDNIFENSFCNVSYSSQPLMVHPETVKQYAKRPRQDKGLASTSKKSRSTILDIVECKKIEREPGEIYFEESESATLSDETEMFKPSLFHIKTEMDKDPNKLFDQLLDQNEEQAKVTIETTKNNKAGANLDHAKIISEVLKKYPHLVKSNKNIKLKIFNNTSNKGVSKKQKPSPLPIVDKSHKNVANAAGFTYETDVLDSKQAAKLIALGAENIEGPWICLICGTPGKALHFTSYYKFRRHLVDIHNEKPVLTICEYCGQRISKRNHLLHHLYTKHGVEPPPSHNFPKCSNCNYVALTEALLVKHKLSHTESKSFRCNVCPSSFHSSNQLLVHIQNTGHKYIADRKHSHQCIYCLRVFIRENNLYAHLKTHHKEDAIKDGIIDESDDESRDDVKEVKHEPTQNDFDDNHTEYHIEQKSDGNIQLIQKKSVESSPSTPLKQKILNSGFPTETSKTPTKAKVTKALLNIEAEHEQDIISTYDDTEEQIVMIDNNEYIMSGNRLILRKGVKQPSEEYILSDLIEDKSEESQQSIGPSTSMDYASILNSNENVHQANIMIKNTGNISQSIPIYVSNEEEYKALMSSNHNIIFDSADENKTLTVLTTPDAATLENTSINMDNSQNNNMMIIHEDYPMNVTEAVATDNSNIVVVYSQQVGGPNKEYQLLTTQALGPQYAQPAAILTQNYETVSTASPVMSAHILGSQDGSWQGNIHENIATNIAQQSEASAVIQSIVHSEEAQTSNAPEIIEEMTDLPQVELIPNPPEPAHFNSNETLTSESLEPEIMNVCQDISMEEELPTGENKEDFIPIEADPENVVLTEVAETVDATESQESEHGPVSENILETEQPAEIISMDVESSDTNENILNMDSENSNANENINLDIQNSDTNENIISMDSQNPEINESEAIIIDPVTENANIEESTEPPTTCAEIVESPAPEIVESPAPEIVEQIQSLASEWSEENLDTPSQDSTEEVDNQEHIDTEDGDEHERVDTEEADSQEHTDVNQTHVEPKVKSDNVEESVENIQLELQKQMLETNASEDSVESLNSPAKHDLSASKKDEIETSNIDPQVKISSLLNDWDDNDELQEGNDVENSGAEPIQVDAVQSELHNTAVIPADVQQIASDTALETAENETETLTAPDDEIIENTPTDQETNPPIDNIPVSKQDNIKSLVSDWDDDEEENKE